MWGDGQPWSWQEEGRLGRSLLMMAIADDGEPAPARAVICVAAPRYVLLLLGGGHRLGLAGPDCPYHTRF
jgi:hypothetical protein